MEEGVGVIMKTSRFKRVCVFCGSSAGKKICYKDAALDLGKELVRTYPPTQLNLLVTILINFYNVMFSTSHCHVYDNTASSVFLGIIFEKISRKLDLVYGGGSIGLMGLISQQVHSGGGHVLGYKFSNPCSSLILRLRLHLHHFLILSHI